jgi:phage FluMu protein Com
MLVRCTLCRGNKKVNGMGYIEQECPRCEGDGFVSLEEAVTKAEEAPIKRKRRTKEEIEASKGINPEHQSLQ